jgi:hypothetical protein
MTTALNKSHESCPQAQVQKLIEWNDEIRTLYAKVGYSPSFDRRGECPDFRWR